MTKTLLSSLPTIADGREYLSSLWWLMHHSDDPKGRTCLALAAYYDDSIDDEAHSSLTVIGGPILRKDSFIEFGREWNRMLYEYRIPSPLHMKDFVRPNGKHVGMPRELKLSLFSRVADIVNNARVYSMSIGVPALDFKSIMPSGAPDVLLSPYAMAFLFSVIVNRRATAKMLSGHEHKAFARMSYVVDNGCAHPDHLVKAHSELQKLDSKIDGHSASEIGAMAFDNDENVAPLQAADVIAWSARRKEARSGLDNEFAPLENLVSSFPSGYRKTHEHVNVSVGAMRKYSRPVYDWLYDHGGLPDISDMFSA